MKELTIEQKAKAYDEAKDRMSRAFNDNRCSIDFRNEIFPELAESKDEKIRKEIIRIVDIWTNSSPVVNGIPSETLLAWLEKQGEQKLTVPKWRYKNDNTPLLKDSLILNKYGCVGKSPSGALVSDVWVIDYDELAKLPKEEIEKQGDEVEPKFKVGDWIMYCSKPYQITGLHNDTFTLTSCDGSYFFNNVKSTNEPVFHLWTIEDAKGGDILTNGTIILIFKQFKEPAYRQHIIAYAGLDNSGNIQVTNDTWELGIDKAKPATKEQRDALMKAMANAGYTFDFDKKELKKIEQNHTWSEENERMINTVISDLERHGGKEGSCYSEEINFLKSLKDRVQPQPKQEWSTCDEFTIKILNTVCDEYLKISTYKGTEFRHEIIDSQKWLKSLKDRYTWKPSDEQIKGIECAIKTLRHQLNVGDKRLNSLYDDLKKLREK